MNGWPLVGVASVVFSALFIGVLSASGSDEEGVRTLVRATARIAFLAFVPVYAASSLRRLWPNEATRWILKNRRYLGVGFAFAHGLHLVSLGLLSVLLGDSFRPELATLVGGGLANVLVAGMALTSFDRSRAWLGSRRWNALHRSGIHWVWFIYAFDWTIRIAAGAVYIPLVVLVWGAAGVRFSAWRSRRLAAVPAASPAS